MMLDKVDIRDAGTMTSFQPDILPDANGGKLGTPIPAELAGCLAQVRSAGKCLRNARQGADCLG